MRQGPYKSNYMKYVYFKLSLIVNWRRILISDVQARARSPKPAQAGPRKLSQARAMMTAWGGLRLRPQFSQARAVGLSRGLNLQIVVLIVSFIDL